jgi:hypothetical protein
MNEALSTLVLHEVTRLLGPQINYLTVWLAGDYGERTKQRLDAAQEEVTKLVAWTKTLDREHKQAYRYWLQYYQYGLHSAYRELRLQTVRREHEKRDAEFREREERTARYAEENPIPLPPR